MKLDQDELQTPAYEPYKEKLPKQISYKLLLYLEGKPVVKEEVCELQQDWS